MGIIKENGRKLNRSELDWAHEILKIWTFDFTFWCISCRLCCCTRSSNQMLFFTFYAVYTVDTFKIDSFALCSCLRNKNFGTQRLSLLRSHVYKRTATTPMKATCNNIEVMRITYSNFHIIKARMSHTLSAHIHSDCEQNANYYYYFCNKQKRKRRNENIVMQLTLGALATNRMDETSVL